MGGGVWDHKVDLCHLIILLGCCKSGTLSCEHRLLHQSVSHVLYRIKYLWMFYEVGIFIGLYSRICFQSVISFCCSSASTVLYSETKVGVVCSFNSCLYASIYPISVIFCRCIYLTQKVTINMRTSYTVETLYQRYLSWLALIYNLYLLFSCLALSWNAI